MLNNKEKEYQKNYRLTNIEKIREKARLYRLNNREKLRKINKEYRLKNKDAIIKQKSEYYFKNKDKIDLRRKLYIQNNQDKFKGYQLKRYGLTVEEYNKILTNQNNQCAICKKSFIKTPHIDHDHQTGKVREILCITCNSILGYANDDIQILINCINYIKKHKNNKEIKKW
jgi:hypothetical protein